MNNLTAILGRKNAKDHSKKDNDITKSSLDSNAIMERIIKQQELVKDSEGLANKKIDKSKSKSRSKNREISDVILKVNFILGTNEFVWLRTSE